MLLAMRIAAGLAIAAATGIVAGLAWAYFADASHRRADPGLVAVGALAALLFAAAGLGAIAGLFAPREGA